jgi:hypothetical protein
LENHKKKRVCHRIDNKSPLLKEKIAKLEAKKKDVLTPKKRNRVKQSLPDQTPCQAGTESE